MATRLAKTVCLHFATAAILKTIYTPAVTNYTSTASDEDVCCAWKWYTAANRTPKLVSVTCFVCWSPLEKVIPTFESCATEHTAVLCTITDYMHSASFDYALSHVLALSVWTSTYFLDLYLRKMLKVNLPSCLLPFQWKKKFWMKKWTVQSRISFLWFLHGCNTTLLVCDHLVCSWQIISTELF